MSLAALITIVAAGGDSKRAILPNFQLKLRELGQDADGTSYELSLVPERKEDGHLFIQLEYEQSPFPITTLPDLSSKYPP